MPRKPTKGYFVRGTFVAEGSELDQALKAQLKGDQAVSKTDLKRESAALQKLGEDLLGLRAELLHGLALPERLLEVLAEARRITNFEGRRRQMQLVGKLMRALPEATVAAAREALAEQHRGSAAQTLALHQTEAWRDRLIAHDDAITDWLAQHPATDAQQLRSLVRQARKDAPAPDAAAVSKGLAPRQGRAYRELFALVRQQMETGAGDSP